MIVVLDANILVRAVLGKRVKDISATHAVNAELFAPEVAYDDAERHLPDILTKRGRVDVIGDSLAFLASCGSRCSRCPRRSTWTTRP